MREMAESLKYASYIQQALLPAKDYLDKWLPNHFLFYRPRDIVSGDFYFLRQRNDSLFVAIADCTGHGVPGAFMSILGINFLNEIIYRGNISNASSVLNQLREHIMKALSQTGDDREQKDGIDIALVKINLTTFELDFSGAFNPLYLVRDGKLLEFPADKMPVGVSADEEKAFTNQRIALQPGDQLYLFTDGFIDQFGGSEGKKFKYAPFRNLILECSKLSAVQQHQLLNHTFDAWKGNLGQLDDVSVLGFQHLPPLPDAH